MSIQFDALVVRQFRADAIRWGEDERHANLSAFSRAQARVNEQAIHKPWVFNREGSCCMCGSALRFYDSKWLERGGGLRMMCHAKSDHLHPGADDVIDGRLWYYWTDG